MQVATIDFLRVVFIEIVGGLPLFLNNHHELLRFEPTVDFKEPSSTPTVQGRKDLAN
jgi:hypothetical protein